MNPISRGHWLVPLALLAAACGTGGGTGSGPGDTPVPTSASTTSSPATTSGGSTVPQTTSAPIDGALQAFVDLAVTDLASRLEAEVSAIEVVSATAVVWPDGSLGCPQPGKAYTQVQVEGYRIELVHQGVAYDYHGGDTDPPFLCESPLEP